MLNYEVIVSSITLVIITLLMYLYLIVSKKGLIFRYVMLSLGFFYGVIPLLLLSMDLNQFWNIHLLRQFDQQSSKLINTSFKSLVFIITLIFSYLLSTYLINKSYEFKYKPKFIVVRYISLCSFLIGSISLIVYTYILGGIEHAVELAEIMRSPFAPEYNVTALKMMQPLVLLSSYLYFILYLDERNSKTTNAYMFLISFIFSLYYFIIFAGRLPFFLYILAFLIHFLVSFFNKSQVSFKKIIFLFLTPIIMLNVYQIIRNFDSGSSYSESMWETLKRYIIEFSFPYINNFVMTTTQFEYRYFQDYFIWIVRIIPSSILAKFDVDKPSSLDQINTINQGATNSGGIPVDIISFGNYQLGYIGIIVLAVLFAAIIRYFELHLVSLINNRPTWLTFLYVKVVMYFMLIVAYMDFDTSIVRKLDYILLFVIIKIFFLTRKR